MSRSFRAYTAAGEITIPDVAIDRVPAGGKSVPLRGYGYVQAVLDPSGTPIGWIGYASAKGEAMDLEILRRTER